MLELNQKQQQTLSFQMMQSMNVLQMGIQELRELVEESVQENPLLDFPEPTGAEQSALEYSRKIDWLSAADRQNHAYHIQDCDEEFDPIATTGRYVDESNDLMRYVRSQFFGICMEPDVMQCVAFLIERLDSNGYLNEDLATLSRIAKKDPSIMERALTELQAADPAGVGARSLTECLRLQIERRAGDHRLAIAIVEDYLVDLSQYRYGRISRAVGAPEQEIRDACDLIRTLNPHPGTGFASSENLSYIIPDVLVTPEHGSFTVSVNEASIPRLTMNTYYLSLLRQTTDPEVKAYLTDKVNKAKWLIRSISQRQSSLQRYTQYIVERQDAFFRNGAAHLLPLTMAEAAADLGVHESTISRAVKEKYLQCTRGIYPLGYFFSHSLGKEASSPSAVKAMLCQLIDQESKSKPLSDQKLCDALAALGCTISRRTVAKYRDELDIPPAAGRKKVK